MKVKIVPAEGVSGFVKNLNCEARTYELVESLSDGDSLPSDKVNWLLENLYRPTPLYDYVEDFMVIHLDNKTSSKGFKIQIVSYTSKLFDNTPRYLTSLNFETFSKEWEQITTTLYDEGAEFSAVDTFLMFYKLVEDSYLSQRSLTMSDLETVTDGIVRITF
jgi:hypothetical protein